MSNMDSTLDLKKYPHLNSQLWRRHPITTLPQSQGGYWGCSKEQASGTKPQKETPQ